MQKIKGDAGSGGSLPGGTVKGFAGIYDIPTPLGKGSSLAYLDGALPGDFGFDPLGLFDPQVTSQEERTWLVTSEVIHGRWAMLGAVGCLVPELLGQQPFFATGWLPPAGAGPRYWADPYTLAGIQAALLGSAEVLRWRDYQQPGSMAGPLQPLLPQRADLAGGFAGSGAPAYPSGVFNCFAYVVSGPAIAQYKESEIRHGRLAMLAVAGFCAQAVLTGAGPWGCLAAHLRSPLTANVFTSFGTVFGQ
ncbi:regulatory chlorophyll a/b-binding protein [Scenedesmus sp. NREL 46B-D3]|nr:regulatory chlorophyll a/b-binding protein [Scenedesmus sp. NREL 46B-D3]